LNEDSFDNQLTFTFTRTARRCRDNEGEPVKNIVDTAVRISGLPFSAELSRESKGVALYWEH